MRKICKSCNKVCDTKYLKCDDCRKLDRIAEAKYKPTKKDFWLMFLRDPSTGSVHCTGYGHCAIGDFRNNPYFIGMKHIKVDLHDLATPTQLKETQPTEE